MQHQNYFVYILTNGDRHTVLYIGMMSGSPASCRTPLAGCQPAESSWKHDLRTIAREKQLKRWRRAKKEALIAKGNPKWRDLFEDMYALRTIGGHR
jgi:putative endonuclease